MVTKRGPDGIARVGLIFAAFALLGFVLRVC